MSTERSPDVRDHPSIPPAKVAIRENPSPILGAERRRNRDLLDAQLARLLRQDRPQVQQHRSAQSKTYRDLRTDFITLATNTDAAMHYDIASLCEAAPLQQLDALRQDAVGCPTPARVDERDGALLWDGEVHRDTVGDGHREQHAALSRRVSIDAVEDEPAVRQRVVPVPVDAVPLMRQHRRGKGRAERGPERAPAADDLSDRFVAPEPKAQRTRRDPGDDPIALGPLRQLEPRDGGIAGGHFGDGWDGRSMLRPYIMRPCPIRAAQFAPLTLSTGRRCARNPVRSARCCGSPNRPGPRGRPGASPYRPGCRDSRPTARVGRTGPRSRPGAGRTGRCVRPCRSACPRRRAATRTASRIRAAGLRTGSRRRWQWT